MSKNFTAGDVVVGNFPYTDKEDYKRRNFLVVGQFKDFVWGIMMSSIESIGHDDGSLYVLSPNDLDFTPPKPTGIRMSVIQTVSTNILSKPMGRVSQDCLDRVMDFVRGILPKQENL